MAITLKTITEPDERPTIFVSYSRADKKLKDQVLEHLEGLERLGILSVWHDRDIRAGVDWYARLLEVLSRTKVAVCLISSSFLRSPLCMDEEIPYLLQAQNRGELAIFPILVKGCLWEEHRWLKRLQLLVCRRSRKTRENVPTG
ncbi:MAG: toll/interleukin-1 receptor domain-containing protein [Rhizobiales bacterium]|nr:toll/interleukin-1 receptor domain-containing protein [Hyphomicrobiales bacterium]